MPQSSKRGAEHARARIERIRAALPEFDLVCSGTLVATQTPPPMATSNSPTLTVLR